LRGKRKRSMNLIIIAIIVFSMMSIVSSTEVDSVHINFTLVAKTNSGGTRPDILNILKQQLVPLGINLDIIIQDWPTFVGELIVFRNFDLCYISLSGGGADPDFTGVYDENGSLNLFGYHTSMDWDEDLGTGKNEWYIVEGTKIMPPNSEERIQHYWEWQDYLMDKICPLVPTVTPMIYSAHWTSLVGYDFSDGLLQSWGKLDWSASHPGQLNTNEVVVADDAWSDLNPPFQDDAASSFISSACMDPLFWYDDDMTVWPHLAESLEMITDTHARITLRENIKWQPDPEGNFTNEYFDVDDVYFTLYIWGGISCDNYLMAWLDYMEKVDERTIDLFIDSDPTTPEKDPYTPFLPAISKRILPEHYLNQTQLANGRTPDITHGAWNKFATHCFGTGLFEISEFDEGYETILTMRPDCWRLDPAITSDPDLDWNRRFGDFSKSPEQLRVRIVDDGYYGYAEFEAGKLDIIDLLGNLQKRFEYQTNPDFTVQETLSYSFDFVGFNMREDREIIGSRELCPNDPSMTIGLAVRKAISYATNKNDINDLIHNGDYVINHWPLYPKMGIWCNPDIIRYDYDLYKAKELMIEAGFVIENFTPSINGYTGLLVVSTMFILSIIYLVARRKRLKNY
jgi:ABC-type transport system substrate-binding protein